MQQANDKHASHAAHIEAILQQVIIHFDTICCVVSTSTVYSLALAVSARPRPLSRVMREVLFQFSIINRRSSCVCLGARRIIPFLS